MKKIIVIIFSLLTICSRITAQNVGIGTTTPLEKLSVVSVSGYGISHESSSIKLSTYIDGSGGYFGTVTNNPFHLYTNNGAAQMTLLQNGRVGIGTSNPLSKFHIFSSSAGGVTPNTLSGFTLEQNNHLYMSFLTPDNKENGVLFGLNSNNVHGGIIYNNSSAPSGLLFRTNGNVNRMVIDQNGNVGIGTTNPTEKMQVNGNVKANSFEYSTPKTFYYSIPPSDFISPVHSTESPGNPFYEFFEPSGEYTLYTNGTNLGGTHFVAPVHLPDNATVTGFTVYGIDEATWNLSITLRRRLHESSVYISMCNLQSSGTPGDFEISSSSISFPVITNQYNNFTIYVEGISSQVKLKSIRITYTLPQAQ